MLDEIVKSEMFIVISRVWPVAGGRWSHFGHVFFLTFLVRIRPDLQSSMGALVNVIS